MEYKDLTIFELIDGIKQRKFTSYDICKYFIDRCEKYKEHNAIIEVYSDVLEQAKAVDEKIEKGLKVGKLAGVPVAIKDNILYKSKKMSCASNFLKEYVAPYSATIVKKLKQEDAIIFGRCNMDEFAMGGSCEKSIYGPCLNAINPEYVAGGSSGGSAVAVALGLVPASIGTDTGGSIRQPSSFNGVVGIKPTYGTVSRYGIVAFASSTDQASPITKTIEENEFMLSIISGVDKNDGTSIQNDFWNVKTKGSYTVGICKEIDEYVKKGEYYDKFKQAVDTLKKNGVMVKEVSIPHILNSLACYYILTPAEATSNLARFDGVKYTSRSDKARSIDDVYVLSRSEGFGTEVKRRIMLGNFVLSSGYFDAYYKKAKQLISVLRREFDNAFKECDAIITPTTPGVAFKVGGKVEDPVAMYLEDLYTVPASLTGIPALSCPYDVGEKGLPLGIQFMGAKKSEHLLYDIANKFQELYKGGK